jgi:hypothetical protein
VCASNGSFASAIRSQNFVKRRSAQSMFWQFGRHFIITAPAMRQRSNSSSASGRAGWIETAGQEHDLLAARYGAKGGGQSAEGIDLAIRFCRAPHPSYAAKRLMGDCVLPVCAPDLLKQSGQVESIGSLLKLPLLHDSATDGDGSNSDWRTWLNYHGRPDASCNAGQHFSEAGMMINAALLGLGVALARASLVADQLASGSLVCPLKLTAPTSFTYYLLGLPEVVERPKIALFRSLLVAEAALTEAFMLAIGTPVPIPADEIHAVAIAA